MGVCIPVGCEGRTLCYYFNSMYLIMDSLRNIIFIVLLLYVSESCPYWASSNLSIIVHVFLHQYWFPRFLLVRLSFSKPLLSVSSCLSLQSWREQLLLCPSLSYRSKKTCWFYSLFKFLFAVRMEWWFPSSLHAETDTLSPWYFMNTFKKLYELGAE